MSAAIILHDHERSKCEVWTRVMGYYRPVSEFNIGKRAEYRERTPFNEIKALSVTRESAVA
ncbi:MAG: anaerobic ribonucleoside-triphosphate reductase [Fibrobacterales bacterium]